MRKILTIGSLCLTAAAQSSGWHYEKQNPATKKKEVEITAASFEQIADGHAMLLHGVKASWYDSAGSYKEISSEEAVIDQKSAVLFYGPHLKMILPLKAQR